MSNNFLPGKDAGGPTVWNRSRTVGVDHGNHDTSLEPRRHDVPFRRPPSLRVFLKLAKRGPTKTTRPGGSPSKQAAMGHLRGVSIRASTANNVTGSAPWVSYARYIQRDVACPERSSFNADADGLQGEDVVKQWQRDGDERLYKFVLSPDGVVDLKDFTRDTMAAVAMQIGLTTGADKIYDADLITKDELAERFAHWEVIPTSVDQARRFRGVIERSMAAVEQRLSTAILSPDDDPYLEQYSKQHTLAHDYAAMDDIREWRRAQMAADRAKLDDMQAKIGDLDNLETDLTKLRILAKAEASRQHPSLEWCAAVHVNTAHPHVHIAVRDRDERGQPLNMTRKEWHAALTIAARKAATNQLGYRKIEREVAHQPTRVIVRQLQHELSRGRSR